ncbi:MAG: WYL domain-containing protein [Sulfurovum sp.]|nr:WYL domain-containing protein [Sulfurovum sp.]
MENLLQHQRHNIILERLKNGETLSITELAREWNTTTKTLQRDFKKLLEGSYGIIRADDGKQFSMAKGYNRSKSTNTAIKMLDSLSADIGGKFYTKAQAELHKIQQHIDSPFYTRIDVEDISNNLDIIEKLEDAISNQKMIDFSYKPLDSDTTKAYKNIRPYKIIIFHGFFYLFAEIKSSKGTYYPKFYLKEIRDIKLLDTTFVTNENVLERINKAIGFWFEPTTEPFEIILHLDKEVVIYFERKPIKDQYLKKNSDGTAELTISVTHEREVFSILKKWLPQVRVIEPYFLQEKFEKMIQEYLNISQTL